MSIYNPNVPQPNDDLSDSQGQLLQNFDKANSSFGTDHYAFANATINNGFHQKTTWVDQSAAIPVSVGAQVVGYANTIAGVTMPYYQRDGLATVYPISPIKAYVTFTLTGAATPYNATILDSFNVTNVQINGPNQEPAIIMTNAMRSTAYGVIAMRNTLGTGAFAATTTYTIISPTVFTLSAVAPTSTATFTVIALET